MADVSAVGLSIRLTASITFPNGINLTSFPEDGDNGINGNTDIADNASGLNGDLITWKKVNGIEYTLNIIPNTDDEKNLDTLFQANRYSKNRKAVSDEITVVETNPITGATKTYKKGIIKSGAVGYQYGGDGRIKNKSYGFVFEDVV